MGDGCCGEVCGKCMASKYIVAGVVVLGTAMYWPDYIWQVLGALLVVKGVVKLAMPKGCGHCNMPAKKGKK